MSILNSQLKRSPCKTGGPAWGTANVRLLGLDGLDSLGGGLNGLLRSLGDGLGGRFLRADHLTNPILNRKLQSVLDDE